MASAYGSFANRGVHVTPVIISKITRADGTIVYENVHEQTKAVDAPIADTVTSVLQQVIARGTGTAAQEPFPVAGKTGTGEDYKNAWFCGYTPTLSTAVWAGFPSEEVKMSPPTTSITVYGGTWPAQIWKRFMAVAAANSEPADFTPPPPTSSTTSTTLPEEPTLPGAPQLAVPEVRGKPYAEAAATIQGAGFTPVRFDVVTDVFPPGVVSGQSPPGGSTAPPGATVTLEVVVPTGDAITVPNVIGMKQDAAVATLRNAGLEPQVSEAQAPDDQPRGRVWKQSPPGDEKVSRGTTVTIVVNPN
jgi:penicillin-binding protein 1A